MTDISKLKNVKELQTASVCKNWIKLINIDKTIEFNKYVNKKDFNIVANVILDNDIYEKGKKQGQQKRKTLIKFKPTISTKQFKNQNEWIYIFTINDRIVKIGGTRSGLFQRCNSYLCGHHIKERGNSGDCSKTNGYIYNTFEFYLNQGCEIKMYGYEIPQTIIETTILGQKTNVIAQTFHAYETRYIEKYKEKYKMYPILCNNCDPNYK